MERMDFSQLTSVEIESILKQKQKEEKEAQKKKRASYEFERDCLVKELYQGAVKLNAEMQQFKHFCMKQIESFKDIAESYGDIRKDSKGGFSLRSTCQKYMVRYDRNTKPEYDERASMAEALIKEFLETKVKKADLQTYRTIEALMSRNAKGDFKPAQIGSLLKIKDNYDDERWIKAMQLFEESFQIVEISYSVSFYEKDDTGKDQLISLNLVSL
jgi:hypothetical protein